MKRKKFDVITILDLVLFIICFCFAGYYIYFSNKYAGMWGELPKPMPDKYKYLPSSISNSIRSYKTIAFVFALLAIAAIYKLRERKKTQNIIERLEWTVERIAQLENPPNAAHNHEPSDEKKWPWGAHHTESLGHLEAAAIRFWRLYDPADPSTAPTNDMVSGWLRDERGVSKDKANAIASILRADGLRTGPRR